LDGSENRSGGFDGYQITRGSPDVLKGLAQESERLNRTLANGGLGAKREQIDDQDKGLGSELEKGE
jgi:hypothetical protein